MEETLTDCLVRVREDLSQLKKVREYLETNAETEEHCSVTWRTIEAFNSILSVCSSQNTPETNALEILLDSFYFLARNNSDSNVWEDFGFELGIICVKILSAIERTEIFELLFCKLLSVISIICEYNSNVWKASARQILNVLINKKFPVSYLEAVLKWYLCIIRNIKTHELYDFSLQNLHLLKTLSLLVQKVGDFDIQMDIMRLIFLHLAKDTKLMKDFFTTEEKKLFQSFQFTDFEGDCRLYLNWLNELRRGSEKKVFSILCCRLFLGGSYVEPPFGRNTLWVDANRSSERMSIKCGGAEQSEDRVIYIHFSEILNVRLENDKTEGNLCLTIQTKSLTGLHKEVRNDDICLITVNAEKVHGFVQFLEEAISEYKKKRKFGRKMSRTMDSLFIDRDNPKKEVQNNAISSSEKKEIDRSFSDVLSLFEKGSQATPQNKSKTTQVKSQQLSPASFVESLNKHLGLDSPELRQTFEDSVETVEFFRKSTPGKSHQLFRSPNTIFNILETDEQTDFNLDENKENKPSDVIKCDGSRSVTPTGGHMRALKDLKNMAPEFYNTQSQEYFQKSSNVMKKKKPCLPRLKRNSKVKKNFKSGCKTPESSKTKLEHTGKNNLIKKRTGLRNHTKEQNETKKLEEPSGIEVAQNKGIETLSVLKMEIPQKKNKSSKPKEVKSPENDSKAKPDAVPSLLDPNGYAYQRWCKPTTSERSNFWLRKLKEEQKSKTHSDVFDFSDESDSIIGKNKKKKKRIINSKRKPRTMVQTKQTSAREAKKIINNSSPKREKSSSVSRNNSLSKVLQSYSPTEASPESDHQTPIKIKNTKPEAVLEEPNSEYESLSSSEDEEPFRMKKRGLSEEENSSARGYVKKKLKAALPKTLLTSIRRRLQKAEEKDRRQTDEIIQVITKATNHLFNHLQRKDGEKVLTYLSTAEQASLAFDSEIDELNVRRNRIQRALLYYKAGCSVSDYCESLDTHFSRVRDALKQFKEKKDPLKTIDRISERLTSLIDYEITKFIQNEWTLKRNKLLRCASILGIDFKEYSDFTNI